MIKTETIYEQVQKTISVTCDRCNKEYDDIMEMQEFLHYRNDAGYGSVLGDGNKLRMDMCQYCVQEVLGPFIRTEGNYIWDSTPEAFFADELPPETIEAIKNVKMDSHHDYLNHLLEGKDDH